MRPSVLAIALVVTVSGCQSVILRAKTVDQAKSTPDLNYQQVLDNLALAAANPSALPYFSAPGTGGTTIQRSLSGSYTAGWDLVTGGVAKFLDRYLLDKQTASATGGETDIESWTTASTIDPDRLYLMRCAYQTALGNTCEDCSNKLNALLRNNSLNIKSVPQGWFEVGKKCQVPKSACYTGHCGHTYLWVMPEQVEALSEFTLLILDIATLSPNQGMLGDVQLSKIKELEDRAQGLQKLLDKSLPAPGGAEKSWWEQLVNKLASAVAGPRAGKEMDETDQVIAETLKLLKVRYAVILADLNTELARKYPSAGATPSGAEQAAQFPLRPRINTYVPNLAPLAGQ